ncbi:MULTISPECIES: DUF2501 domain-containing protein [Atlantibacter]|uniref:DUF2501 domain-containing protein n=1 Tax=Atlantibacter TaxID=1903434 RepID=UPI001606EDB9|nr:MULTISPECIES: DUF2501 domain-containing protein [Atlantibacter]MBB3321831.1 hypothetical protein [Atlantibacter sp. RC6]MBL7634820.1 DUF2501 domain-containing protein [Atlantibacter hermannii]MBL7676431.1 DUF2501 domain-containing protein [Atlantibacter hermannii]MCZ7833016.1 DUF2501 domain-containing protein [Atlantibacter hermannii]
MKSVKQMFQLAACGAMLMATSGYAATWQESLSSAASQLSQTQTTTSGTQSNSLSSLSGLLTGGSQALSSENMPNVAGILGYCMKQKLVSATNTENVKNQIMEKLGLSTPQAQTTTPDYTEGLMGLLNTAKGEQLDLATIGNSPLAEKVKTKACDLVLKQGVNFLM